MTSGLAPSPPRHEREHGDQAVPGRPAATAPGPEQAAGGRHRFRSLQTKLGLVFAAIIGLAFLLVFLLVVPQLRSNMEEQRLNDLERATGRVAPSLEAAMGSDITEPALNELVRSLADRTDSRVTLLGVQRSGESRPGGGELALYVISDSNVEAQVPVRQAVAERAVRARGRRSEVAQQRGTPTAQSAEPLNYKGRADWVVVLSRDLGAVSETVGLVRTRLVVAALVALVLAVGAGFLVARALASRVRRREAAAEHVAAGDFIEPLPADSEDELGQLTRKFNDMQAQLARLDRARREFIANASHELRTPIFSLGGFAELLEDEELDPATRAEFVGSIREQVDRLKKLAGDLLDLSRLDAGSLELNPEPVDLATLGREVAAEFRPALERHDAALALELEPGVEARCDRERAAQVLRILIDNALRHTPSGARIALCSERRDGLARLTVSDSGPELTGSGIEPGSAANLFERFYTADAASGSGLGLAIAKELVERMDGEISVRPGGERTVFEVGLPAA